MTTEIKIKALPHAKDLPHPAYQSAFAAGVDLPAALLDEEITLKPGEWHAVPTGFALELPQNWEAQIRPRSGLAAKFGVTVLNSPGTIDADYRGEIKVLLINGGREDFTIHHGERIAQMVIAPVQQVVFTPVNELSPTLRGAGGFGSTGY